MKICKFWIILFVCFVTSFAHCAELNVSVDKKTITDGDTFRLNIEYNGDDNQVPDISPLLKDFQIVSRANSNQVSIINGQISQIKKWTLDLKPKKTGKITIKPLKIGNISSNYIDVEVKELSNVAYVPNSEENINSPYFQIEQSLFPKNPFVQQQMIIAVTVYDSIGLQNGTININEATQKDWIISPLLDKPLIKKDIINGKKMNIATFVFAAFPQKSGELVSPQFFFEGFYLKNKDIDLADFDDFMALGFNFQNLMAQKVPVRMRTKDEKILVKPVPDSFSGKYWLPLKNLKIEASIPNNDIFKVGDAIRRQLKITATGAQKNMIPQVSFENVSAFKQYPEAPETSEQVVNGNLVTTTTINTVFIPLRGGKQTLPTLSIDWFNVDTQKIEQAVIPEEEIMIQENTSLPSVSSQLSELTPLASTQEIANPVVETTQTNDLTDIFLKYKGVLLKLLLFILLLSFICLLFFISKSKKNPYKELVIKAIKKHDYKAVRSALISWASIKFGKTDIQNLHMVANLVQNEAFTAQLTALNKILYSPQDETFNGAKFIEIFKKIDKLKKNVQKTKEILPNLYN